MAGRSSMMHAVGGEGGHRSGGYNRFDRFERDRRFSELQPLKINLTKTMLEKAQRELNEDPASREGKLQQFKAKIYEVQLLRGKVDDAFLLRFLRARKFDVERAFDLYYRYYKVRSDNPQVFRGLSVASVRHVMAARLAVVLPYTDPRGRRILYLRLGRWNPAKVDVFDLLKLGVITMEKLIEDEATQVNGIVVIGDFRGFGEKHAASTEHHLVAVMASVFQSAFPMRVQALHSTSEPHVAHAVFSTVKLFLKRKMRTRIKLHGRSLEHLHQLFDRTLLPQELGGELGPVDDMARGWNEELERSADTMDAIFQVPGILRMPSMSAAPMPPGKKGRPQTALSRVPLGGGAAPAAAPAPQPAAPVAEDAEQ